MPAADFISKNLKSLALALIGAISATIIAWATSTDFGLFSTLVAAFVPTLVNSVRLYLESKLANNHPAPPPAPLPPEVPPAPLREDDFNWPSSTSGCLLFLLALAGCGSGTIYAQERPRAVITGPEKVASGTLLTLRGTDSQGGSLKYLWRISPEIPGHLQLAQLEGGAAVQVATFPGKYVLTLVVSNEHGADIAYRQLEVTGDCVKPDPETPQPVEPSKPVVPTPVTPPGPPKLPQGEFGISQLVYDAAMQVNSPSRSADARKLSAECEALSSKVSAGALSDPQAIANAMADAIKQRGSAWSAFSLSVGNKLKEIYLAGKLSVPSKWATLILEAKIGLDEVAKR